MIVRAALVCLSSVLTAALAGCGIGAPLESCDLELTVEDREFDVECDFDDDEGEYECECTGNQIPASQEPPTCAEQCEGEPTCAEQCAADPDPEGCGFECEECEDICQEGRDDGDGEEGPAFSEDFQDDSFCNLSDSDQESAAIAACDLE